jgi:integrase
MLKDSSRTTSFIPWRQATNLILSLIKDGNHRYALIIAIGIYTGLRISDILSLKWTDIIGKDQMEIKEKKTGKMRIIRINPNLKKILDTYTTANLATGYIFGSPWSKRAGPIEYHTVNLRLKEIFIKYKVVTSGNVSSHILRKTFGRRIWDQDGQSERALIMLSKIFRHSTTEITRKYLGISQEEIDDIYLSL